MTKKLSARAEMPEFKQGETKDMPFDPNKVGGSCAGLFTYDAKGNWRWMTTEETANFHAAEDKAAQDTWAADTARHDDDGHGSAIGAKTAGPEEDDDLGSDWGNVPEEPADITALKNVAATQEGKWEAPIGQYVSGATEQALADSAKSMIDATVGNSANKRYYLVVFDMANVDEGTSGGQVAGFHVAATIEDRGILEYAKQLAWKQIEQMLEKAETTGSLEV